MRQARRWGVRISPSAGTVVVVSSSSSTPRTVAAYAGTGSFASAFSQSGAPPQASARPAASVQKMRAATDVRTRSNPRMSALPFLRGCRVLRLEHHGLLIRAVHLAVEIANDAVALKVDHDGADAEAARESQHVVFRLVAGRELRGTEVHVQRAGNALDAVAGGK